MNRFCWSRTGSSTKLDLTFSGKRLYAVAEGKGADFIVLDANPLDDIRNTRRISDVYLRGRKVNRSAMATKWKAACGGAVSTR